jgi:hypothetical protein
MLALAVLNTAIRMNSNQRPRPPVGAEPASTAGQHGESAGPEPKPSHF